MDLQRSFTFLLCLVAFGAWAVLASAQQTPTDNPGQGPAGPGAGEGGQPASASVPLPKLIKLAREAVERVEDGGADAQEAMAQAQQYIQAIRAQDRFNPTADFFTGRLQLSQGRPREAIQLIDSYVRTPRGQNDWLAYKLLGDLYSATYQTLARDKYRRAAELNPTEPDPHAGLARTELELGRPHVAVEHARKAVQLNSQQPADERKPDFDAVLARALMAAATAVSPSGDTSNLEQMEQALDAASRAVELAKQAAMEDTGNTSLLGKLDEYLVLRQEILRQVLELYPERIKLFVDLSEVLRERAEVRHLLSFHEIIRQLEPGMRRAGDNPPVELLMEWAWLQSAVGNTNESKATLEKVLEQKPDHQRARQMLEQLEGGGE